MHLDQTAKMRLMALFIIAVMLVSTAGFAIISQPASAPTQQPGPQQTLQPVVYRELSGQEVLAILQAGRMIIRHYSPATCEPCKADTAELEQFARAYSTFLFVQEVNREQAALEIIGFDGKIENISRSISQASLLDLLCEKGGLKPKECVLREIGEPANNSGVGFSGDA